MLSYDFRAKVPVTVAVGARALYQDYDDNSGLKYFRWDVTQYGPMFILSFLFCRQGFVCGTPASLCS